MYRYLSSMVWEKYADGFFRMSMTRLSLQASCAVLESPPPVRAGVWRRGFGGQLAPAMVRPPLSASCAACRCRCRVPRPPPGWAALLGDHPLPPPIEGLIVTRGAGCFRSLVDIFHLPLSIIQIVFLSGKSGMGAGRQPIEECGRTGL